MSTYAGNDIYTGSGTLVDDASPPTGANVNPFLEFLADRTTWLKNRTGTERLVGEGKTLVDDSTQTNAIVNLGGTDATFNSTSFALGAGPRILHIDAADLAGLAFTLELEVTGTVQITGDASSANGCWLRLDRDNGSVAFAIPGAQLYFENPYVLGALAETTDDGDTGTAMFPQPTRASWTTATYGATQHDFGTIAAKENDVVEVEGFYHVTCSSGASGHSAQFRVEVKENSGSYSAVAGARAYANDTDVQGFDCPRVVNFRHQMAADGTLHVALNGRVDAATDSATGFLVAPSRIASKVWTPGQRAIPVTMNACFSIGAGSPADLNVTLDAKMQHAGTVLSFIGSLTCRWRVWRVNP